MAMIPLIGFAPDLDPTTPGVMVDCKNMYPTVQGFRAAKYFNTSYTGSPAGYKIKSSIYIPDNQFNGVNDVYFYGGDAAISRYSNAVLTNVSYGGAYFSDSSMWDFAVMGVTVLAARRYNAPLQAYADYTSAGTFSPVATAPGFATIAVNGGFVMGGGVYTGGSGGITTGGDRWACSGYQDYTAWTPSVTTECTTGRLVETDGDIVAMVPFRDGFVAYKKTSMYYGEYVGAPDVFRWRLISKQYGAIHKKSVVDIGDKHVFMGINGLMVFDGATVTEAAPQIRKWLTSQFKYISPSAQYFAPRLINNRIDKVVYAFYPPVPGFPSSPSWITDTDHNEYVVAFNYETGNVGVCDYTGAGITDVMSAQKIDYVLFGSNGYRQAFDSASFFPSFAHSFTTWSMGDDFQRSLLSEVKLRANQASPSSVTMTNYYRDVPESFTDGGVATNWNTDATTSISDSHRFFRLKSARWHKLKFDITGETEISAIGPVLVPDGTE